MAVLSKIRQKSVLLIVVIGVALLAFIIGDLVRSGGGGSSINVGSVNGVEINTQEFLQKVTQIEQNGQIGNSQANEMVWDQEVNSIILETEFEKLGLKLGKDQIINVIKQNPNFANNPQFLNQLGQFDISKFNSFVLSMKDAGQEQWNAWLQYEKDLELHGLQQMYFSMIQAGLFTTTAEAKASYLTENSKVTFNYVTVPYTTINNEEASVSDSEIETYIKKHENKFKSPLTRKIEFAYIDGFPSENDKEEVKEKVTSLLKPSIVYNSKTNKNDTILGFQKTKDIAEFVNRNSDIKYDSLYYSKSELPLEYQEELFNLAPGEVYGPYEFNGYYCLTRLVNKKLGEKVKAAHILITHNEAQIPNANSRTKEEAKAEAERILKELTVNPDKFGELAMINSEDPGSKNNAGEYDNIGRGQMVKPFEDFIFSNAIGKPGIVETDFGFHVIKVLEKKESVQLATIAQLIEISDVTSDAIYSKAGKVEQEATSKSLEEIAKEMNIEFQKDITVRPFDEQLPLIGKQRGIVTWAFGRDTKEGDIKRFESGDGYIIAKLNTKNETGLETVEQARPKVEPILMNEKKASIIRKKMEGKTIEEVSSKTGASILIASDVTRQNPLITNIGPEARVVATAFATNIGENSALIDGNKGVYIVNTKAINQATDLPNYNTYKNKTNMIIRNTAQNRIMNTLKNTAKIKDKRIGTIM